MKHPRRRWEGIKRARRILRVWRRHHSCVDEDYDDRGPLEQKLMKNRQPCSCPMCGNLRRWFGVVTRQERKAVAIMRQQLQEFKEGG